MLSPIDYLYETNFAVTICDTDGLIIYMNQKSESTFAKYGGKNLIGKSLYACHNSNSCDAIKELLKTGKSNSYTIEKNGEKKLIYQTPIFHENKISGLVELSIVLSSDMPHFVRS
jgi:transcriptional regulator with PAS, ATPase and Fis domain